MVEYRSGEEPKELPFAAYSLQRPEASGFRAFDTPSTGMGVAGMMRHATAVAAERAGWSAEDIRRVVLGHGEKQGEAHLPVGRRRFMFLPVPTIEGRGSAKTQIVGAIRRVLVLGGDGSNSSDVVWAREALAGMELVDEKTARTAALLRPVETDPVLRQYTAASECWTTVTPMVLPGHNDPSRLRQKLKGVKNDAPRQRELLAKLSTRTDELIRKAMRQAGLADALVERAEIEWRAVGYLPGVESAERYLVPRHLTGSPRVHVRIRWRDSSGAPLKVKGPLVIGSGRYYGSGLLVSVRPGQMLAETAGR